MQRNKNVAYDEGELYSEDEDDYGEGDANNYTEEDRENFTNLTPVVRAELEEAGVQVSDLQIEEALWHYYWDVGKSVAYLKNAKSTQKQQQQQSSKKEKPKSRFDEAAQKSAETAGELSFYHCSCFCLEETGPLFNAVRQVGNIRIVSIEKIMLIYG